MEPKKPVISIMWHGVKRIKPPEEGYRVIPRADLYVDARGVRETGLKGGSGHSPEFQAGVKAHSQKSLDAMEALIIDSLKHIPSRRGDQKDPYKEPYVVCFLCAWGMHRSPASGLILAERLREKGFKVEVPPVPSLPPMTQKPSLNWLPGGTKE